MARTTCQALSQFFGKSGDADKTLPWILPNFRLVLVGLDVDPPDRRDWWLHRKLVTPKSSRPRRTSQTRTSSVIREQSQPRDYLMCRFPENPYLLFVLLIFGRLKVYRRRYKPKSGNRSQASSKSDECFAAHELDIVGKQFSRFPEGLARLSAPLLYRRRSRRPRELIGRFFRIWKRKTGQLGRGHTIDC